jgi:hypothetical protein
MASKVQSKILPTSLSRASFEPPVAVGVPALLPAVAGVCKAEDAVVVIVACDPVDELMMPEGRGIMLSWVPPVTHAERKGV